MDRIISELRVKPKSELLKIFDEEIADTVTHGIV